MSYWFYIRANLRWERGLVRSRRCTHLAPGSRAPSAAEGPVAAAAAARGGRGAERRAVPPDSLAERLHHSKSPINLLANLAPNLAFGAGEFRFSGGRKQFGRQL